MEFSLLSPRSPPNQVSEVKKEKREAKEEHPRAFSEKHRDLISTFPQNNEWKFTLPLYKYQGFWNCPNYIQGLLLAQENFKPQSTDVIISTHPKAGTTWLKALAFAIVERNRHKDSSSLLLTELSHDVLSFFEIDAAQNINRRNPEIPLLATHFPYSSLPSSVIKSGCKIVYMCRDPKDVFVSLYYFQKKKHSGVEFISIENAFELFCRGVSTFGPYLDHVLEYWKASLEWPERVLFLKYEDMKSKPLCYLKKLAEFIGYPFTPEEERSNVVQEIITMCSFEKMKDLATLKNGEFYSNTPFSVRNTVFFRKGQIGDWKNHLTKEMGDQLDKITEEKLNGSGLSFLSYH
ncbi:flavonol 3-sulfotransferase-like [Mercurialis annua]|uniref:flavonol 3-sulfotransferase-like n=1 Tax=Mercurialis annua TaxID=3986 RepID=UPI0024AD4E7B|nr:flavonol 3-sulfotransferase-like [Mercurialis annua]